MADWVYQYGGRSIQFWERTLWHNAMYDEVFLITEQDIIDYCSSKRCCYMHDQNRDIVIMRFEESNGRGWTNLFYYMNSSDFNLLKQSKSYQLNWQKEGF